MTMEAFMRPATFLLCGLSLLGCTHGMTRRHEHHAVAMVGVAVEESSFPFEHGGETRTVYRFGRSGPPVLLMHEIDGLTPETQDLARLIAAEGYSVFLPLFFGDPGQSGGQLGRLKVCLRHDFHCFSNDQTSPVVQWLRALLPEIRKQSTNGGSGIGVIGMCLTGAFPLALMEDPAVKVVVLSQPSVPLPWTRSMKSSLGMTQKELAVAQERSKSVRMLGFRFYGDRISPKEKFETLASLFGDRIELKEFPRSSRKNPHAVLTASFVPEALKRTLDALNLALKP